MTSPACAICSNQLYRNHRQVAVIPACGHSFHAICIFQAQERDPRCPTCQEPLPDRGAILRIAFQSGAEPENEVLEEEFVDYSFSGDEDEDGGLGSADSHNDDRRSDGDRAFRDLSRVFAEQAIQLRRVQEEKDEMQRKLAQKERRIEALEARIRVLQPRSSENGRGNGRNQALSSSSRTPPPRPSRRFTDEDFAWRFQLR